MAPPLNESTVPFVLRQSDDGGKMTKIWSMVALAIFLLVEIGLAAEPSEGFKIIHVQDLSDLIVKQPTTTWIYDADPPSVREKEGIIPGAKLLSSSSEYDLGLLPSAKTSKLVFYCHNPH